MFGDTPMGEAFRVAKCRFQSELAKRPYEKQMPILLVLSDGTPTDASAAEVIGIANSLRNMGILVVSCYVTDSNIMEPRHLYGNPKPYWADGASLMFDCASIVPPGSSFRSYLIELGWLIEENGRLFTQVGRSERLSEFMSIIISPLRDWARAVGANPDKRFVFVSYCHKDKEWLERLTIFVKALEKRGVSLQVWVDTSIKPGERWHDEIRLALRQAWAAILIISEDFLASDFIADEELPVLLRAAEQEGVAIMPLIARPSTFSSHPALGEFQAFNTPSRPLCDLSPGDQDRVFVKLSEHLMNIIDSQY